jgi:hypothetical protein
LLVLGHKKSPEFCKAKLRTMKIRRDGRHGWRLQQTPGVLRSKTPKLKNDMDVIFEPRKGLQRKYQGQRI